MTVSKMSFVQMLLLCCSLLLFTQCTKEILDSNNSSTNGQTNNGTNNSNSNNQNNEPKTGMLKLQMTDAPIDNANIKAVFVTITEIKIDGEIYEGFNSPQSINVLALQNGKVEGLGIGTLETGTYGSMTLVLNHETDANGETPGCYVLTADGTKESLDATFSSTQEILISHNFEIEENTLTELVIDFDLRKAITAENEVNGFVDYNFVTAPELRTSLRVIAQNTAGTVTGMCTDSPIFGSDKIIVYAYPEGTFEQSTEINGQGSSQIKFLNATTSAVVQADDTYQLSFLSDGEYELIFASYQESSNGELIFKGVLEVTTNLSLDIGKIRINANNETTIDVTVIGLLP